MFRLVAIAGIAGMVLIVALVRPFTGRGKGGPNGRPRFRWTSALVSAATFACTLALAVTGFGATLYLGEALSGYPRLAHMALGGLFVFLLCGLAFFRCADYAQAGFSVVRRFFFWSFLATGLAAAVAILPSLTPWADADTIGSLYEAHRWCALAAVMAFIGLGLRR